MISKLARTIANKLILICVFACLASTAHANIIDDFNRSNNPDINNGWIEKTSGAFILLNGTAAKNGIFTGYRDNIVYRPATENLLNVEASVELDLNSNQPGYPQILVRVQTGTVDIDDQLDGYILYVNDSRTQATLGRQRGSNFVSQLANLTINPQLNTTDTFRLRLSANGTDPVQLNAFVERFNGANWDIVANASANDASGQRITTPGSVGFGGYVESSYSYDNFRRIDLDSGTPNNPVPVATNLLPNTATAGASAFALQVTGADFVPGSVVRWNGGNRSTTFISDTSLSATITAAEIATAGNATVAVFNPTPGGGLSSNLNFTIEDPIPNNPIPTLVSLAPNNIDAGTSAFSLTVNGSDFVAGSIVRWDGVERATTFISANQLSAAISAADVASVGNFEVGVFSPAPGGGLSATQTFTVNPVTPNNPVPVANTVSPSSTTAGGGAFTLTVNGSDFVNSAVVRWNGVDRGTTFVSANQLTAAIAGVDIASAGNANVTVFNPAPGGGISNPVSFTIDDPTPPDNPVPTSSGLNPNQVTEGDPGFTLVVFGSDFVNGAVVRWDGNNRPTSFISASELQTSISAGDIATAGSATISVFNPAPGGGGSNTQTFTIQVLGGGNNPTPILDDMLPSAATVGDAGLTLDVMGNDFTNNSVVRWNGADRSTTYVSSSWLQINVSSSDLSTATVASLAVFTPGPGGGTSSPQNFFVLDASESYFADNFSRADANAIGNGWTEKNAPAFNITNGEVRGIQTATYYYDNMVYRPAGEDRTDVEVAMEFTRQGESYGDRFPQVHARVQRDSVAQSGTLESYIFFVDDFESDYAPLPGRAIIAVQPNSPGNFECYMAAIPFPTALAEGTRYRLRFQVSGLNPVQLTGFVEEYSAGTWQAFASGSTTHDDSTQDPGIYCGPGFMPAPITNGGSAAFSKWLGRPDHIDNFYWRDLSSAQAVPPAIFGLSPNAVSEGDPGFTLTVNGSNFSADASVQFNGANRSTTFISANQLDAQILTVDIASAGTANITVSNSAGTSNSANLQIIADIPGNPLPVLSGLTPSQADAGDPGFTLTLNGADFGLESVVRWNGSDRMTTFVSDTELQAAIDVSDLASSGTASVEVFTPVPGGGTSVAQAFNIIAVGGNTFFDDFARADNPILGNSWQEKSAAAFDLNSASARKLAVGSGYLDNLSYRPISEALLDVEMSAEIRFNSSSPGYPQVLVRVQGDTVANSGTLDGYILYVNDDMSQAVLGRQTGNDFVGFLSSVNIAPAMNTSDTYRMRLRATATNPVNLEAYVERFDGGSWTIIGQTNYADSSGQRIDTAGTVGFGGYVGSSFSYDNVQRTDLTP